MTRRIDWRKVAAALVLLLVWGVAAREIAFINLSLQRARVGEGAAAAEMRPGSGHAAVATAFGHYRAGRFDEAATSARVAVLDTPLNAAGLRILGQALNRERPGGGNAALLLAGRLGWRDVPTQLWLLQQATMVGELEVAGQRAEAVIRTQTNAGPAFTLFRALSIVPEGRAVVTRSLAARPIWRGNFFEVEPALPAQQLNAMVGLIDSLARTPAPVSFSEARSTIEALFAQGRFGEAASIHQRVSGRRSAVLPLDNGGFELGVPYARADGANPFGWRLTQLGTSTATVEAPPEESGNRVLVGYADGQSLHGVMERMLMLPPGRYVLTFRMRSSDEGAERALGLQLFCPTVQNSPELMQIDRSPLPIDTWINRTQIATIPSNCPVQRLALLPLPPLSGPREAWFDDVVLRPAG